MTHGNKKLNLDYGSDEIRRAQNKISGKRVRKYAFPSICSLELDLPIYAEYQAIQTYDRALACHGRLKRMLQYVPYKMAAKTMPTKSNTRGGGAIADWHCGRVLTYIPSRRLCLNFFQVGPRQSQAN